MKTVLAVPFLLAASALGAAEITGEPRIVDGDTFTIGAAIIRLDGVDAPETGQRCETASGSTWDCDEAAIDRLAELVEGKSATCEILATDPYGRLVSRCIADGIDVSRTLVAEGLAWAEFTETYIEDQVRARAAGAGIWRDGADPTTAKAYRADRWARAAAEAPGGCPIKGNIGSSGERIYHTPWSRYYTRTKISEAKGERWFCDELEAVEAGWRSVRAR